MVCLSFIVLSYFYHLGLLDLHCIELVPFRVGIKFKEFHSIVRPQREKFTWRPNLIMKNEF